MRVIETALIGTACMVVAPLATEVSIMDLVNKKVEEQFVAFGKEHDPASVQVALDLIETAERNIPVGDETARNQALARRLHFISALDRNIDPKWDPKKLPVKGTAPPTPHGKIYPSGEVDLSAIPDPAVRAEYERALKASKDYERWYDVQYQLRRIDERAMSFAERFVAEKYLPADRPQLERILSESQISDARKKRLQPKALG
jgi:hypothetical protein